MANFDPAVTKTLKNEGGAKITEDPNDRGGLTKFGISQRAFPDVDIRALTEAKARGLYKSNYWDKVQGDAIANQAIAENLFDTAVNMGAVTTTRLVQMALEISVDGAFGSNTLKAINSANAELFLANFTLAKVARYAHLCNRDKTQNKYLLGWINRALGGVA